MPMHTTINEPLLEILYGSYVGYQFIIEKQYSRLKEKLSQENIQKTSAETLIKQLHNSCKVKFSQI